MMYMGSLPSHKWTCGLDTAFPWASAPTPTAFFSPFFESVSFQFSFSFCLMLPRFCVLGFFFFFPLRKLRVDCVLWKKGEKEGKKKEKKEAPPRFRFRFRW